MTVCEVGYANKIDEPFRALRITGRWDRRAGAKEKDPPVHLSLFFLPMLIRGKFQDSKWAWMTGPIWHHE